jgi:hypothetical protein
MTNPIRAAQFKFLWQCATVVANDVAKEIDEGGGCMELGLQFNFLCGVYQHLEKLAVVHAGAVIPDRPASFGGFMPIDPADEARIREIMASAELE